MRDVVVHYFPRIWPGGGPPGYLYNLRAGLAEHFPQAPVVVAALSERHDRYSYFGEYRGRHRGFVRRFLRQFIPASWKRRRAYAKYLGVWEAGRIPQEALEQIERASVVVFHDPRSAWWYTRDGRRSVQQVYVELHAPVDVATEDAADLRALYGESELWETLRCRASELELRAYENADGLLVPCPEAVEAYFLHAPERRARFARLRLHSVAPGAPLMRAATSRDVVRARLGVRDDELLVGFFGRYHAHKGFDHFCEVAALAHRESRPALRFLSAGDGWLRPPALPNYMNLGWLGRDLADVLAAVDCLLQPNRHTFLDLMFLEAMSVGQPIITTPTGGNRWLASLVRGVIAVDADPRRLLEAVEAIRPRAVRDDLSNANRHAYNAMFTLRDFAERHVAFARQALGGMGTS